MEQQSELELLEQYASVTNSKILERQSDLNPKDHAMPEMLAWCREQKTIVVLQSGNILSSNPSSRLIPNCKIVMFNQGLVPGDVHPTTSTLIHMLLENAEEPSLTDGDHSLVSVSSQQQRLRMLIKEALDLEASDIHIEVREKIARIRFRKHGELFLHAEWLPKLGREIAAVAFNKETDHAMTHFNPTVPQSAAMPLKIEGREIRLRLASLPAHQGFDMTMRLLTAADDNIESLEVLGYLPHQISMIKKAINMPHGAVIMSGPTGSGKTTTLASCMQLVDQKRKVFTIEDPVEKTVPNITQIPVNTEHDDRDFANMARTVLRMDPDVIVLGEMRDEDTASVMVRAAITGHLVFSTVHTNTAPDIVTRLTNLGISRSLLASPHLLVCLICQRLAPLLCQQCRVPITHSTPHQKHLIRWRKMFGNHFSELNARGQNCDACHGLGIQGRIAVAEIIWVDEVGRQFIQQGDTLGWRNYLKTNGWTTYHDHLLELVKSGKCDPLDAEHLVGEISDQFEMQRFNYRT